MFLNLFLGLLPPWSLCPSAPMPLALTLYAPMSFYLYVPEPLCPLTFISLGLSASLPLCPSVSMSLGLSVPQPQCPFAYQLLCPSVSVPLGHSVLMCLYLFYPLPVSLSLYVPLSLFP